MKRNVPLAILVGALTGLGGCQPLHAPLSILPSQGGSTTPGTTTPANTPEVSHKGTLSISIRWPERSYPNFNAQAIPTSTSRIELVAYVGETAVESVTLLRPDAHASTSETAMTLDAGTFRLEARAYRDQTEVARGDTTVNVLAGTRAPARIQLGPLFAPTVTALSAYGGAALDTIILTGEHFGSEALPIPEVRFNGVLAALVKRQSDTSLEVTVPTGATTGLLTVKSDGIPSTSHVVYWVADGLSAGAPKASWDPSAADHRIVLSGEALQFQATPNWIFAPGESAESYGNPPAVTWSQIDGTAGTMTATGRFTAGTTYASAKVRAFLGSLQSNPIGVSAEEVESFTMAAGNTILGGKGSLSTLLRPENTLSSGATTSAAVFTSSDAARIAIGDDGRARAEDFGSNGTVTVTATSQLRANKTASQALTLSNYTVTTLVGGLQAGTGGEKDGDLATARFHEPRGITVDAAGRLYLADDYYSSVRKIDNGQVSTLITGIFSVYAIAWGPDGNLYVPNNNYTNNSPQPEGSTAMRVLSPAGTVTYLPGSYYDPQGVAFDTAGNLYYTERQRVRKRSQLGEFTSFGSLSDHGWVDGLGTDARFMNPLGLAADAQGNVYVADTGNHRIRKISASGTVSTLAGTGFAGYRDGQAAQAQFNAPGAVAVDAQGNVFVADFANHRIRKITPQGDVMTIVGQSKGSLDGVGTHARIGDVFGITCDTSGALYLSDHYWDGEGNAYRTIRKIQ
jgi:sugar lactone lactonase YvrE